MPRVPYLVALDGVVETRWIPEDMFRGYRLPMALTSDGYVDIHHELKTLCRIRLDAQPINVRVFMYNLKTCVTHIHVDDNLMEAINNVTDVVKSIVPPNVFTHVDGGCRIIALVIHAMWSKATQVDSRMQVWVKKLVAALTKTPNIMVGAAMACYMQNLGRVAGILDEERNDEVLFEAQSEFYGKRSDVFCEFFSSCTAELNVDKLFRMLLCLFTQNPECQFWDRAVENVQIQLSRCIGPFDVSNLLGLF